MAGCVFYFRVVLCNRRGRGRVTGHLICFLLNFRIQFPIPRIICTSILMLIPLYVTDNVWLRILFPVRIM